jgi:hypothetical protein
MHAKPRHFFESWSAELASKASRVRDLIGSAHWLSDGHHKESLLIEHLSSFVDSTISLSRGFVVSINNDITISSGEIDILVAQKHRDLFWLDYDGLLIIPPSAASAQIHVKTTFGVAELADVLNAASVLQNILSDEGEARMPWSAGFFFIDAKNPTVSGRKTVVESAIAKWRDKNPKADFPIDCIAILGVGVILFNSIEHEIRFIGAQGLSSGIFVSEFYYSTVKHIQGSSHGAMERYLEFHDFTPDFTISINEEN